MHQPRYSTATTTSNNINIAVTNAIPTRFRGSRSTSRTVLRISPPRSSSRPALHESGLEPEWPARAGRARESCPRTNVTSRSTRSTRSVNPAISALSQAERPICTAMTMPAAAKMLPRASMHRVSHVCRHQTKHFIARWRRRNHWMHCGSGRSSVSKQPFANGIGTEVRRRDFRATRPTSRSKGDRGPNVGPRSGNGNGVDFRVAEIGVGRGSWNRKPA